MDRTEVAGEVDGHMQGSSAKVLGCGLARCELGRSVEGIRNAGAVAAARGGSSDDGEVFGAGASSGGGCRDGGGGGMEACGGGDTEAFGGSGGGGGGGDDGDGGGGGGGGGDDGWTPSLGFCEQPLEMEETPFFSQMTARFCGGGPFPSYRAQNAPRGERAHLRLTTQNPNTLMEINVQKKEELHE